MPRTLNTKVIMLEINNKTKQNNNNNQNITEQVGELFVDLIFLAGADNLL